MPKSTKYPTGRWHNFIFFLAALLVVASDQLTKIWIRSNLALDEAIPPEGFFRLTHVQNTGAIFGFFRDHTSTLIIGASVGIVFLLICAFLAYRWFPVLDTKPGKLALGLILGGTIGNLIDRVRLGHVTDFIDVGIWPTFNLADSSVVVGIILLASYLIYLARTGKLTDGQDI